MTATEWRGRLDEVDDDLPIDEAVPRRREARALLGSLLRPYRLTVGLLAVVVIAENAARLSVPLLVQRGIDHGVPPLLAGGSARELIVIVAMLAGVARCRPAAAVLPQPLRARRPAGAAGAAPPGVPAFPAARRRLPRPLHSGRVVSRSRTTSKPSRTCSDRIRQPDHRGAHVVRHRDPLVALDVRLGLMCLAAFPRWWRWWWFRNESAKTYRKVRESAALVIVQFVETMTGIKAVQAYRREPRNQEIFEGIADDYRRSTSGPSGCWPSSPGVKLVGNLTTGVVLLYGGYRVLHGDMTIGTLTAFLLYLRMFFEPCRRSQFFNTFQSASSALEKLAGVLAESRASPTRPTRFGWERCGADRLPRCAIQLRVRIARCCRAVADRSARADRRPGRHHRRGQDHHRQTDRPLLRPGLRSVTLDGIDLRSSRRRAAPARRDGDPGELPVLRHRRGQHPVRQADGLRRRGGAARPRWVPTSSSRRCRTATTPMWPSVVAGCPPGSASWSRSPGVPRRSRRADPRRGHLVTGHPESERLVQRALRTVLQPAGRR